MYSWHISVAGLPIEPVDDFDTALAKHVEDYFEREPPKRHVADEKKRHAEVGKKLARAALDELLAGEKPTPGLLTRDQKRENEDAKKKNPNGDPAHADPTLSASVTISGLVPSGEPGDHSTLSVSVSLG